MNTETPTLSMYRSEPRRCGFTMIEVFAVLLLISLLIMLLLPAVQSSREMARRTSCANNLTQIALGLQAYHSAFGHYPVQLSGSDGSAVAGEDNDRRLSFFVGLIPFLGQRPLMESMQSPMVQTSIDDGMFGMGMWSDDGIETMSDEAESEEPQWWPIGGPEPFNRNYVPWRTVIPVLRCPSDPGVGDPAFARTNYAACLGDGMVAANTGPFKEVNGEFQFDPQLAAQTEAAMRGLFVPRVVTRMSDVTDGLSYTIMLGELATDLGDVSARTEPVPVGNEEDRLRDKPLWALESGNIDPERPEFWASIGMQGVLQGDRSMRRGFRWADGMPLYTAFNTILPPNRELVLQDDSDDSTGLLPPSSRHQGGAHVALADTSVRFINDSIDTGDLSQPTVYLGSDNSAGSESPYGIWGALGTRASAELSVHRHELGSQVE